MHQPQRREAGEQVALDQLHEGGRVGVEVVRAERVEVGVAGGGDVDHRRHVELDQRLVQREPVRVGERRRGPVPAGRVGVEVAADEAQLLDAPAQLGDGVVERAARRLRAAGTTPAKCSGNSPTTRATRSLLARAQARAVAGSGDVVLHRRTPAARRASGRRRARAAPAAGCPRCSRGSPSSLICPQLRLGQRRVRQPGQLGVAERRELRRRGRVVAVAVDDHEVGSCVDVGEALARRAGPACR